MKHRTACLVAVVLLIFFPGVGQAHRVNIFAYVDGDAIQVECYFSKSRKVINGSLLFTDLETRVTLLEGTTDEQGVFRFRPDAAFLKTGHGLNILLNAGAGHQKEWRISPEELTALSPAGQSVKSENEGRGSLTEQSSQFSASSRTMAVPYMDTKELEAIIVRVMDAKLAPIRQTLARQESGEPTLRDVIGGIGWIIGLLGLATHMKYRR